MKGLKDNGPEPKTLKEAKQMKPKKRHGKHYPNPLPKKMVGIMSPMPLLGCGGCTCNLFSFPHGTKLSQAARASILQSPTLILI